MWLDEVRPFAMGPAAMRERLSEDAFRPFGIAALKADAGAIKVRDEVRARLPFGQLRTFSREIPLRSGASRRVLLVPPLAGAYPFLMRDLVVALLSVADEVGVAEWPNARYVPLDRGRFGFAENCLETAQMTRALAAPGTGNGAVGEPSVHVVGVCQGAVPALAAALLLAEAGLAPKSLTLMGGPIDPSRHPTRVWRVLQARSLEALEIQVLETVRAGFPGVGRRIFPAWRQVDTFALYLWRQTIGGGELPYRLTFDEGDDPARFPLARLCWTMMDVAGEFFMENVSTVFRENALMAGTLSVAGRRVEPAALTGTALLTVEGGDDDIAGVSQTEAAHDLCAALPDALRRRLVVPRIGHFSLFYGRAMRERILPAVAEAMDVGEAA